MLMQVSNSVLGEEEVLALQGSSRGQFLMQPNGRYQTAGFLCPFGGLLQCLYAVFLYRLADQAAIWQYGLCFSHGESLCWLMNMFRYWGKVPVLDLHSARWRLACRSK